MSEQRSVSVPKARDQIKVNGSLDPMPSRVWVRRGPHQTPFDVPQPHWQDVLKPQANYERISFGAAQALRALSGEDYWNSLGAKVAKRDGCDHAWWYKWEDTNSDIFEELAVTPDTINTYITR